FSIPVHRAPSAGFLMCWLIETKMATSRTERRRRSLRCTGMSSRQVIYACLLLLSARAGSFLLGPSTVGRRTGVTRRHQQGFGRQASPTRAEESSSGCRGSSNSSGHSRMAASRLPHHRHQRQPQHERLRRCVAGGTSSPSSFASPPA
ncbi:unnamed protein product, partial [Scytosiphon promiscuus]